MFPATSPFDRGFTSGYPTLPSIQLSDMSDVPCYTCRRRHVKCDRLLPHWYVFPLWKEMTTLKDQMREEGCGLFRLSYVKQSISTIGRRV